MVVTIETENKTYDIQADEDSSIYNTLQILAEKNMLKLEKDKIPENIYSVRKKRNVPTKESYRKCGIYQGDILKIK